MLSLLAQIGVVGYWGVFAKYLTTWRHTCMGPFTTNKRVLLNTIHIAKASRSA
jgi:hypothetical protein